MSAFRSWGERRTRPSGVRRRSSVSKSGRARSRRRDLHGLPSAELDHLRGAFALERRIPAAGADGARGGRSGILEEPARAKASRPDREREHAGSGGFACRHPRDLGHRQRRDERRQGRHDPRGVARGARARRRQRLQVAAQARRPAGNGHRDAPLLAHARRVDRRHSERRARRPRRAGGSRSCRTRRRRRRGRPRISRAFTCERSATTAATGSDGSISRRRAAAASALGAIRAASSASKRNWRARFDSSTTSRSTSVILPKPARTAISAAAAPTAPTPTNTIEKPRIRCCPAGPIPGKSSDREYRPLTAPPPRAGCGRA